MIQETTVQPSFNATPRRPSWWRVGAASTFRFAKVHGWRPCADNGRAPWIGREWNGRSDIKLDSEIVTSETVAAIIGHLRKGIAANDVHVARLPDRTSVRRRSARGTTVSTIVIDIDFGEFILPVSVTAPFVGSRPQAAVGEVSRGLMDIIETADTVRKDIGALDMELRNTVVEQSILAGVTPLWFRMPPWHLDRRYEAPLNDSRELTVLMLDQDLRPIISGVRQTWTAKDITYFLDFHGKTQRRRAAMRAKLVAAGSYGCFTEIAQALIEARGLDPVDVLNRLWIARQAQNHDGIVLNTGTTRERLTLVEGVVDATIEFDGGYYWSGKLTLKGDYPATLAMAAKGRRLAEFVDHPAFRATGVTINYARILRGRLRLYHGVRTAPMTASNSRMP